VVHQPVHRRDGHSIGGEHVLPLADRLVAGHQQGPSLVAVHHQFEQHRGLGLVLADLANVIDDKQGKAIEPVEGLGQGLVGLGPLQFLHQRGSRVEACRTIQADQAAADARC